MGESMQITSLKTLKKFSITARGYFPPHPLTVYHIPHAFQNWAGINILEEIELKVCTGDNENSPMVEDLKRTLDIIVNRGGFPSLRGVVANIQHFSGGLVGINDQLRQALMSLEAIDSRICIDISPHLDTRSIVVQQ